MAVAAAPAKIGVGWTRSLSEGGATVELAERLRSLSPLRVRVQTDRGALEAEAQVVWIGGRAPDGGGILHGLAFTRIAPEHFQTLCDILPPLAMRRHAGIRLPLDLAVTCQPTNPPGPPLHGRTANVNRGGFLLRLPRLLPPRTRLEVTLHAAKAPLWVEGAVVWVEPPEIWKPGESIGHGVQFIAPSWSTMLSLSLLLAEPE
jgi:hypothetical protein